ncbi:Sphingomyelin phosphodiesterase, acidlike 3B, putative [Acanthamoeba castellanii str. Neff]|uniref:Sphingomyelin phosphodiesterase, acidlike 3B, putative n=1 Tax=Acanthamoeba castellanii (strain ATCC 30010 / Neff) TaxID=1257118 RepID=L8GYB4_ACACF|nr:Sphingomyelin phosphodiesterase, acidlike 3B, putative [Acanthamoeba castellanii str. Neff]ELR18259.1 Sphingomyelin phosphodiesterase, acidlike 3B, putative [Acanthamoeba castellanii str. Neff]
MWAPSFNSEMCTMTRGADSPRSLVAEALSELGSLANQLKPDFILWSGDTGRHGATSPDDIYAETTMVTSLLRQVTNNYPWVLPVLGNNDCFDNCVGEKENDSITRNFTQIWSSYLKHVDSGQDFFRGGYMYTKISNQLLVLSLNTMFWTQRNCALNDQTSCGLPNSPGAVQFEWMEKVVSDPAHKHMNFILHGHIPPLAAPLNGDKVFFTSCLEKYHSFTKTYKDRIKGHLYADKHIDSFYVMPNNIGTVLVNPAVVPLFNTGIRVFSYDRKTGDLLNYWQHYINITKANDGAKPTLELEYSPLSPYHGSGGGGGGGGDPPGYGLKDLSQASWDWLDSMIVDNTTMKLLFERYYFVSYPVALPRGNREEAVEKLLHGQWEAHRKRQSTCHCSPWPTS